MTTSPGAAPLSVDDVAAYCLVVEDEAAVRAVYVRILEAAGYTVKLAESAAEALDHMMSQPAAAVLCDVRMPGPDGFWLAERIHTRWPETPIVMVTGLDDEETIQRSRELGAAAYVSKPVTPDELLEAVRHVMGPSGKPDEAVVDSLPMDGISPVEVEAEYALETPLCCPSCGERLTTLKAVRLVRGRVNFTSTLPRRGRVTACPYCLAIIPAELSNF